MNSLLLPSPGQLKEVRRHTQGKKGEYMFTAAFKSEMSDFNSSLRL